MIKQLQYEILDNIMKENKYPKINELPKKLIIDRKSRVTAHLYHRLVASTKNAVNND